MRILKYVVLLLLLSIIAFVVFIATQNGNYTIQKTRIIPLEKNVVFNYVNDYRNWEAFGAWKSFDPDYTFTFPVHTVGLEGSYSWKSSSNTGITKTVFIAETDSIAQLTTVDDKKFKSYWTFKSLDTKTEVTWFTEGELSFLAKFKAILSGGIQKNVGQLQERTLENLDKILTKEINTFDIQVVGITTVNSKMFLQQKYSRRISDHQSKINAIIPGLLSFVKQNNIGTVGRPFVVYDLYDIQKDSTKMAIAIPITEEIFTTPESQFTFGKLEGFTALKTTLKGDYSHAKKAWAKANDYIKENKFELDPNAKRMAIFVKNFTDTKNPSEWITEIYIPIKSANPVTTHTESNSGDSISVPSH
jgi:effector-binding domain-containing protein